MDSVLSIKGLTKRFGRITAVDNLFLDVEKGSVFGLLGPNGSGKTTTLGMITGVLHATSGDIAWFGRPPVPEVRKKIGAIIEAPLFYPYLTGIQNLKIVSAIKEVDESVIGDVLAFAGLEGRGGDKFRTYSLGMKQRLAIAAALLNSPQVLILDEPTNGLDPQGIIGIRDLIRKVAAQGTTIILASHLLDEVEKVCSHVAILRQGKAIFSGRVSELSGRKSVEVSAADMAQLTGACKAFAGVEAVQQVDHKLMLSVTETFDTAELNRHLAAQEIYVRHLSEKVNSLEEKFLEKLKEA